jgi:hypothetical protein
MPSSQLSDETRVLLETSVESFEKLDILLFLWRRRGHWEPKQVAVELALPPGDVSRLFEELTRVGLTSALRDGHYTIAQSAADSIGKLARAFEQAPVEVVRFLSARAMYRARSTTARAFAEAFLRGRSKRS